MRIEGWDKPPHTEAKRVGFVLWQSTHYLGDCDAVIAVDGQHGQYIIYTITARICYAAILPYKRENGMSHIVWELRTAAQKLGNACTRSMSWIQLSESGGKRVQRWAEVLIVRRHNFEVHTYITNKTTSGHLHSTIHKHPHWINTSKPDPASFWKPLHSATACH